MNQIHLLIVEDDSNLAEALSTTLRSANGESMISCCAGTLADGMAVLRNGTFDAVLLDLGLPDSEGVNTFTTMKVAAGDLPIIVFSADEDPKIKQAVMAAGAADYLVKGHAGSPLLARSIRMSIERDGRQKAEDKTAQLQAEMQRFASDFEKIIAEIKDKFNVH